MTSHKHSFQCFDAVVEKPALTTGHNFALPQSCACTQICLEQLNNHRCSLCSESQKVEPVISEVIEKQPASCYQSQSLGHQHIPRRPMRPDGDPLYHVAHRYRNHHHPQYHTYRHRKRIVLVKNSNPTIQKTILLHCKPVHSLKVFMEDVSELMHCLIRKLYTLDGCKVDCVQSLLHGPSILVCVGHEPFHPFLLNSCQKNSEDKLPQLFLKSESSICNEDYGNKKNVNFGLKSKKGPFPNVSENKVDDDVEKRVFVDKDGSLSLEIKMQFRLLNDKSLQCCTNIKKSSSTSNVCFTGQDNVYYSHCGQSEHWSEVESLSASEAEDVYISKLPSQKHSVEPHCQHSCTHCQEYDIRNIRSARFSVTSDKIKHKKESLDSIHNTSCEEYTEQIVEKMIQHPVGEEEKGDYTVQHCTISRCSSRSEVCSVFTKKAGDDKQIRKNGSTRVFDDKHKNHVSSKNINQDPSAKVTPIFTENKRPVSIETNSSDILASLKEDEDKEENNVSPSNSKASQSYNKNDEQMPGTVKHPCTFLPCELHITPESPYHPESTRTSSIASSCSVKFKNSRKAGVKTNKRNVLTIPNQSQNKELTEVAVENGNKEKLEAINQSEVDLDENHVLEVDPRACDDTSSIPKHSTASELLTNRSVDQAEEGMGCVLSNLSRSPQLSDLELAELDIIEYQRENSSPDIRSVKSNISEVSPVQSAESISALSTKTNISVRSTASKILEGTPADINKYLIEQVQSSTEFISVSSKSSNVLDVSLCYSESAEEALDGQASSTDSNKASFMSNKLKRSTVVTKTADALEEERLRRPLSAISSKSSASVRSTNSKLRDENDHSYAEKTDQFQDRCISNVIPPNTINFICKTLEDVLEKSGNFHDNLEEKTTQSRPRKLNMVRKLKRLESEKLETNKEIKEEMPLSTMSLKSSVSIKSEKCKTKHDAPCVHDKEETEPIDTRSQNALSVSAHKSRQSKASGASKPNTGNDDNRERTPSGISCRSSLSDGPNLEPGEVATPEKTDDLLNQTESAYEDRSTSALSSESQLSSLSIKSKDLFQERAHTSMSAKSNISIKSSAKSGKDERDSTSHISNTFAISSKMLQSDVTAKSEISDRKSMEEISHNAPSHMTGKSVKSINSSILDLADKQTDTLGLNKKSKNTIPSLKMLMTEVSNTADIKIRAFSALSNKSNSSSVFSTSESVSASVSIGIVENYDDNDEEDNSVSCSSENSPLLCSKYSMKTIEDSADSSLTEGTIVSDKSNKSKCNYKNSPQSVTDNEIANNSTAKKKKKQSSSHRLSSRSAYSDFGLSKTKDLLEVNDKPKSNPTNKMYLKACEKHCKATAGKRSKSNLSSDRYTKKKEAMLRPHSADVPNGSVLRQTCKESVLSLFFCDKSSPSNVNANKSNTTEELYLCGRTFNGSFIATDADRNIVDDKSEKNCFYIYKQNTSSLVQSDNDRSDIVPSTLPSSSPTEVVNEWLKKIPLNSSLYDVEDEFHCEEEEALAETLTQNESGNENERDSSAAMLRPENDKVVERVMNNKCKLGDMRKTDNDPTVEVNIQPCTFPPTVHLMKILLNPKLKRCHSLLEVSPVYGRKLSMSARRFLDSLVNLQLLDVDTTNVNDKAEKYNHLMNMLQSLWLCENHNRGTISEKSEFDKQLKFDEKFKVKSFLDVPFPSSFQDSGKSRINKNMLTFKSPTNTQRENFKIPTKNQESDKIESKSDSATLPENEAEEERKQSSVLSVVSDLTKRNNYTLTEKTETTFISDHEHGIHLESPSSEHLSYLAQKISHNTDRVWLLNLLNYIEKQVISQFVTAVGELKVHLNLNHDKQLDVIINKLKDKVHERIQDSINNELKEIQGPVGIRRSPKESIACESSTEKSEQRRRRLIVNLSRSIDSAVKAIIKEKGREEVCDDLTEGKGCAEGETVRKDSVTEHNMTLAAETVKQEVPEGECTYEKDTEVEASDNKTEDEKIKNRKINKVESIKEINHTTEERTAIEFISEKARDIYDDETEKHDASTTDDEEDETSEKGDTAEAEKFKCTDNKDKIANNESFEEKISQSKVRETDNEQLDVEENIINAEKSEEEEESADIKTYEYRENSYDSSYRKEIIQIRRNGDFSEMKKAEIGKMSKSKATNDDDCERLDAQTAEDTADDDKAEYRETAKDIFTDVEEIPDGDEVHGINNSGKSEIAENRDSDDDDNEISKKTSYNGTIEEHEETYDDVISDEKETVGAVVKKVDDIAGEDYNDDDGKNDDKTDEEEDDDVKEKTEQLEETQRTAKEIAGDANKTDIKQFIGDKMTNIANGQINGKLTFNKQMNYETVQKTGMDTSHSEEDSKTPEADIDHGKQAEDGTVKHVETPNDNMADDESTDNEETSNDNVINAKHPLESDIGQDDNTSGAKTADDTADEREANEEEISELEIAQNGETDCNESLVTDGEVNSSTNESSTDKDVTNTHNIKTKPNSERNTLSIDTEESDGEGAEAVETIRRMQVIKNPAMQPTNKEDIKMISSVKMYLGCSEDEADADSEDSDSELHSIYRRK